MLRPNAVTEGVESANGSGGSHSLRGFVGDGFVETKIQMWLDLHRGVDHLQSASLSSPRQRRYHQVGGCGCCGGEDRVLFNGRWMHREPPELARKRIGRGLQHDHR